MQDSQLGPSGVHYREVPLYTGQPAGSQWCPLQRGSTVYRTASWVPVVSSIERFHCMRMYSTVHSVDDRSVHRTHYIADDSLPSSHL